MCFFAPPQQKKKKSSRGKKRVIVTLTEEEEEEDLPSRPRTVTPSSQPKACAMPFGYLTDDMVEYLQEHQPNDPRLWEHYRQGMHLKKLGEKMDSHMGQTETTGENLGKGVKDIQERLKKVEAMLEETKKAAKGAQALGEEDKGRRAAKLHKAQIAREDELKREVDRLKKMMEKQQNETTKPEDISAQVLRQIETIEHQREFERLKASEMERSRTKKESKPEPKIKPETSSTETLLRTLDDYHHQRDQQQEFERLKALEKKINSKPTAAATKEFDIEKMIQERLERFQQQLRYNQLEAENMAYRQKQEAKPDPSAGKRDAQQFFADILESLKHEREVDLKAILEELLRKENEKTTNKSDNAGRSGENDGSWMINDLLLLMDHLDRQRHEESQRIWQYNNYGDGPMFGHPKSEKASYCPSPPRYDEYEASIPPPLPRRYAFRPARTHQRPSFERSGYDYGGRYTETTGWRGSGYEGR